MLQMSIAARILVIANLPPYVLGGAENQVARLVETWVGFGRHVEVAGHQIPDGMLRLGAIEIRTHRIAVIDRLGRIGRAISYFVSLARLLRRIGRDFDIVYCRGLGDGAISICLLKAMGWTTLPLIACPINARGAGDARFIRSIPGWARIVATINRHCDAINIIAPAIEDDLAYIGITQPFLHRIPNGIPLAPRVIRNEVAPVRRLVWTGRLTQQKGIDILLTVLAKIATTGRRFRLALIGDGPDAVMLQDLCLTLGLQACVSFLGALPRNEIRDHLVAADAFVLPSRYEGMSNAALEAMEAGLPLFLTRCGGIDVYINENIGWSCDPEDNEAMFESLCQLLDASDVVVLAKGSSAREMVERKFSISSIAERNIEIMDKTVASVAGISR